MQNRTLAPLGAAALLSLAGFAPADQLTVPSPEYPTIGSAVAAAVAGDEILLLDGVYEGVGNWDIEVTVPLVLRGASGDAAAVVIQGPDLSEWPWPVHRALLTSEDVTIADLTFSGFSGITGGAVLVTDGQASFENVTFTGGKSEDASGCEPGQGTAVAVMDASASFEGCTFTSNTAYAPTCTGTGRAHGGAIYAQNARLTFDGSSFSRNQAAGALTGFGGAIAAIDSDTSIVGCDFSDNSGAGDGAWGGAVHADGGTLQIQATTFLRNNANGGDFGARGGAIHARDAALTIVSVTLDSNRARGSSDSIGGGAIYTNADMSLTNALVVRNQVTGWCDKPFNFADGGGLYVAAGVTRIAHATFELNTATCSSGVHAGPMGTILAANSIFRDGAPSTDPGGVFEAAYSNIQGGLPGEGNIDAAPIYQPGSLRLASGSPGVDAGSVDLIPADVLDIDGDGDTSEPLPLDLDGLARRADDPATPDTGAGPAPIPDMGAYELATCAADFDGDGELTLFDFLAFQNAFDAGDPLADFDGDGELTLFDFLAFQNAFDAGCD